MWDEYAKVQNSKVDRLLLLNFHSFDAGQPMSLRLFSTDAWNVSINGEKDDRFIIFRIRACSLVLCHLGG